MNPGSGIAFDIYVGDFLISLHERFSITENSYLDPTVSGTGGYAQLQNEIGVTTLWDLNKLVVSAGYDHVNYVGLNADNQQQRPDGSSDLVYASFGSPIRPDMMLGLQLGGGLINYGGSQPLEALQWNAGLYYTLKLSEYLRASANVGYTVYSPRSGGFYATAGDTSGVYAFVSINHRLNEWVNYSLSGGRNFNLSFFGGFYEVYAVELRANWRVFRKLRVSTPFTFQSGTQYYGLFYGVTQTFDQFGAGIHFGRNITRKLSAGLGYQYVLRMSNQRNTDYTVNTVSLSLGYQF